MTDDQLHHVYANLAQKIAAMVQRLTGDQMTFLEASPEQVEFLEKLHPPPLISFFYHHFAPSQVVCGNDSCLLPIDGIQWHVQNSPGIHLLRGGYVTIAFDYSGTLHCVDNQGTSEIPGPPVVAFGLGGDYLMASEEEMAKQGRPLAESFMSFLQSFTDESPDVG